MVVALPSVLAALAGSSRVELSVPHDARLSDVLDSLVMACPAVERRIRDETGDLRRYVNVYVDGHDVRGMGGVAAAVRSGSEVRVIASVAGG